jgi:hypothetical protein
MGEGDSIGLRQGRGLLNSIVPLRVRHVGEQWIEDVVKWRLGVSGCGGQSLRGWRLRRCLLLPIGPFPSDCSCLLHFGLDAASAMAARYSNNAAADLCLYEQYLCQIRRNHASRGATDLIIDLHRVGSCIAFSFGRWSRGGDFVDHVRILYGPADFLTGAVSAEGRPMHRTIEGVAVWVAAARASLPLEAANR